MFETLLSYGKHAKKSQLTCKLFYKDDPGRMESILTAPANGNQPNHGLQSRHNFVRESREFDRMGRLQQVY